MHITEKQKWSEFGVQVEFAPVVNRDFQPIAYEAIMQFDASYQERFSYLASDRHNVQTNLDFYYTKLSVETYKGTVPLILNTQLGVTAPIPKSQSWANGSIIFAIKQAELFPDEMAMQQINQLSGYGVEFVIENFFQCYFYLPFLINLRPSFIKLAWDVIQSCADDDTMNGLVNLLKPLKESGTLIIVDGIEDRDRFERVELVADAFQGFWFSQNGRQQSMHNKA